MELSGTVRRIGVLSTARISLSIGLALGFIIGSVWGVAIAFFSTAAHSLMGAETGGAGLVALFAAPLAGAVIYGLLVTMISVVMVVIYNIAAGTGGGLEIEFETADEPEKRPPYFYV